MNESMNAGPVKSLSSLFTIHVQLLSLQYNTVKGQNMHRGKGSIVTLSKVLNLVDEDKQERINY